jgi:hypothetical protein
MLIFILFKIYTVQYLHCANFILCKTLIYTVQILNDNFLFASKCIQLKISTMQNLCCVEKAMISLECNDSSLCELYLA